ncbi:MAG TPA: alcohol dehydrogenase catalytic domain-containing protein, partial [Limnochordia bacterium]|nr:alcohol dehydrogenase catalytic domain-containing protein [Limnochordia bacterium]
MRAAIVEAPDRLRVRHDVPMPRPGRFQALVRIECCATCNGTDDKLIHGGMALEYPAILGHESVGTVTELGPDVTGFAPGERVLRPTAVYPGGRLGPYRSGWGGYAEWGLVTDLSAAAAAGEDAPAGRGYARYQQKVPAGISTPDAAMAITLKETLSWSRHLGVGAGSEVLIVGDGPVGLAFTAWVV